MRTNFIFKTSKSNQIRITTFAPENESALAALILVHGFKGFKDWGFFPYAGEYFAKHGFFTITFNFSHNGVGENLLEFTETDKFAKNTISLEIDELKELTEAVDNGFFDKKFEKIGIIGHSRGGATALIAAAETGKYEAVCTWSSIAKLDRYTGRQKEEWRNNGKIQIENTRTKQIMDLNITLLEDIEANKETKFNLTTAVKKISAPLLIAHGGQDLTVPIEEAEILYAASDKNRCELLKINNCGHTFNIVHPFEKSTIQFEKLLKNTNLFFEKHFI